MYLAPGGTVISRIRTLYLLDTRRAPLPTVGAPLRGYNVSGAYPRRGRGYEHPGATVAEGRPLLQEGPGAAVHPGGARGNYQGPMESYNCTNLNINLT